MNISCKETRCQDNLRQGHVQICLGLENRRVIVGVGGNMRDGHETRRGRILNETTVKGCTFKSGRNLVQRKLPGMTPAKTYVNKRYAD